ncbi:MAG TPA: SgcJ/EcaC family oxidoreductase [Steroidobacteraceae bacterium]|nr:SgcJ/EcaC family oxidoreductase [Steroidobacteraceae bacterium]
MKILKSAAIVAAGLLALAGCQKAPVDTAAEMAAIKAVNQAWNDNYAAGDAGAIVELYADDAVVLAPGYATASGRDAIRTLIETDVAGAKAAGISLNISPESTVDMSGDIAWQTGTFTVTDASGAQVDTGKYLTVLRKKDGKWSLIRDAWNSDAPPPAPAAEEAAAPAG